MLRQIGIVDLGLNAPINDENRGLRDAKLAALLGNPRDGSSASEGNWLAREEPL